MKQPVSLIALDMDGTLFNGQSEISRRIRTPFAKLPPAEFTLPYRPDALTPGFPSHFYPVSASPMPSPPTVLPSIICRTASASMNLRWSLRLYAPSSKNCKKSIHMDAFINGDGFSQRSCEGKIDCLDMPTSIKRYIHRTRTFTDDLAAYIRVHNLNVQKMTLNFIRRRTALFSTATK